MKLVWWAFELIDPSQMEDLVCFDQTMIWFDNGDPRWWGGSIAPHSLALFGVKQIFNKVQEKRSLFDLVRSKISSGISFVSEHWVLIIEIYKEWEELHLDVCIVYHLEPSVGVLGVFSSINELYVDELPSHRLFGGVVNDGRYVQLAEPVWTQPRFEVETSWSIIYLWSQSS